MAQTSVASAAPRRGFKEFIRKFFVSVKRNPQNIPLVMMVVTFVIYSLNLTSIADTTAKVSLANMGQCEFVSMLLGILAFVSFLNAYPRREKPKLIMVGLTVFMNAVMIFCDIIYGMRINQALTRPDDPIQITEDTQCIVVAQGIVSLHIILLIVCIALIVLQPIYSKMLKKINTSIDVAGNDDIAAIDLASED